MSLIPIAMTRLGIGYDSLGVLKYIKYGECVFITSPIIGNGYCMYVLFRVNYFETLSEEEFRMRFRLSKNTSRVILEQIRGRISSRTNRNRAITAEVKLLLALRFYASGSMLLAMADFTGVSKASAGRIAKSVTLAIASLRPQYIFMPQNDELNSLKLEFYRIARFPFVIGAIDCTHVRIQSPGGENAELYRNRKGYFSWNVQTIADAKLKIRDIVARWPGSTHDQTVFNNSVIKRRLENGEFGDSVILGDSGYAVQQYLLPPLANPNSPVENLYNESQIRTRNVVERSYGVWKRRFPILSLGLRLSEELSKAVIIAVAVLHNVCIDENDHWDEEAGDEEPIERDNGLIAAEEDVQNRNSRRLNIINNYFATLL